MLITIGLVFLLYVLLFTKRNYYVSTNIYERYLNFHIIDCFVCNFMKGLLIIECVALNLNFKT